MREQQTKRRSRAEEPRGIPTRALEPKPKVAAGGLQVWGIDDDEIESIDRAFAKGGSGILKLQEGETTVRFLPARSGDRLFVAVHEHFIDDCPAPGETFRFACPRYMSKGKERCPACEDADKLRSSNNPIDKKAAKRMSPGLRVYANVINRDSEEDGPKTFAFGRSIWGQLKKIKASKNNGGDFTNPGPKGFDIVVSREGTGFDTEYDVTPARNDSVLCDDAEVGDEWVANQPDLTEYTILPDPEELLDTLGSRRRGAQGRADRGRGRGEAAPARRELPARSGRRAQDEIEDEAEAPRTGRTITAEYAVSAEEDDVPI